MEQLYYFNSSYVSGHYLIHCLPESTVINKMVGNLGNDACQKEQCNFFGAVNGVFWYEPATFKAVYKVIRSKLFIMEHDEASQMMNKYFPEENAANRSTFDTLTVAADSNEKSLEPLSRVLSKDKTLHMMPETTFEGNLKQNRGTLRRFSGV